MLNCDYTEMLRLLNASGARYLVVGAYAVIYYTEPRLTRDLDLWIDRTPENARRTLQALAEFGAPVEGMQSVLEEADMVLQIGIEPLRIDIMTGLSGLEFEAAWQNSVPDVWDGVPVRFLSKTDLISSKQAAGRPKDRLDLEELL